MRSSSWRDVRRGFAGQDAESFWCGHFATSQRSPGIIGVGGRLRGMATAEVDVGAVPHRVPATYHADQDMPNVYRCRSCDAWVFQLEEAAHIWLHTDPSLNPPQRRSALWIGSLRVSRARAQLPPKVVGVVSAVAAALIIAVLLASSLATWGGAGGKVAIAGAKTRPHVARIQTGTAPPAWLTRAPDLPQTGSTPQVGSTQNPASSTTTLPASTTPKANQGVGTTAPPSLPGAGASGSNSALPPQTDPSVTDPQQVTDPESPTTSTATAPPPDDTSTTAPPPDDTSTTAPPPDDTSTTTDDTSTTPTG
jgi:hypothetical protein